MNGPLLNPALPPTLAGVGERPCGCGNVSGMDAGTGMVNNGDAGDELTAEVESLV
ncbi:MAG: hypothetical protein ACRDQ5_01595 [Sciscionella sp.]